MSPGTRHIRRCIRPQQHASQTGSLRQAVERKAANVMMRIIRKKKNTPPVERLRKVSYSAFSAFVRKSNAPMQYYLRGYGELPPASPSKRHVIVPKITVTLPLRRFLRCRSRLSRRFSQISHSHAFTGVFHRSVGLGWSKFGIEGHGISRIGRYKKIPRALPNRILSGGLGRGSRIRTYEWRIQNPLP